MQPHLIIILALISLAKANIECHYCGLRQLCPLPYDEDKTERISCAKSCMKFDGYSDMDNRRVLVRGCGAEDLNRCSKNSTWFGAKGEMCICNAQECNNAHVTKPHTLLIMMAFLKIFAK